MIQDQRVIATSAVQCVGNTLLLQGRVYSPPYVIKAIGNTTRSRPRSTAIPRSGSTASGSTPSASGYDVATSEPASSRPTPAPSTSTASPAAEGRVRGVRAVVGVVGELAITAGRLLLLFVVWQLGVVGITANRAQAATVDSLERQFAGTRADRADHADHGLRPDRAPPRAAPQPHLDDTRSQPPAGDAFAILRIPRLGAGWAKPVYQGVGADVLAEGIGHYPDTQLPGQVGNVGLAGHRAGHGNPLIDIDTIRPGDAIVVETADALRRLPGRPLRDRPADRRQGPRAGARPAGRRRPPRRG